MIVVVLVFLVVFGLVLGSFVNALVWRLHAQQEAKEALATLEDNASKPGAAPGAGAGKSQKAAAGQLDEQKASLKTELKSLSMTTGRSMCSSCRHPLAPKDLVPFFSWLFLGGKCRYCRKPIQDPPVIELLLPALFLLSYMLWPVEMTGYGLVSFGLWLVFLTGFMALAVYDIRWFLLPDKIVWPLVGLAVVQVLLHAILFDGGWPVVIEAVWGVAVGSGVFLALYLVAERLGREWIGFGDVKLGIVLGLLVGGPLPAIFLLYIASLIGLAVSLPLLLIKRLKRSSLIPYGPFLLAACVIVVLGGQVLTSWTDTLFGI